MRIFYLTFLPMLAMAVLTVIVGERLAKREVEESIPIDRDRVLDFTSDFDTEIKRLDTLYLSYLKWLTDQYSSKDHKDTNSEAREVKALKSMYLFSNKKRVRTFNVEGLSLGARLPEVSVEGHGRPLSLERAVIIPKEKMEFTEIGESGWLSASDRKHLVYWTRSDTKHLVAAVIDKEELHRRVVEHFTGWLEKSLTPLRESSAHFSIISPIGELAHGGDPETRGAAALIIPQRLHHGTWQVLAWDGVSKKSRYSMKVMLITLFLAVVILLCGFLLYHYQCRSLKLARQRVSFVNQVSHELGSPLTNISLNLDLAMDTLDADKKEVRHRLSLVAQEIGRLHRLVANVLTFSRSDRGTLDISKEPCMPDDIITSLIDSWRPALVRRSIQIDYDPNVNASIETDPDALTQIVSNLISNVEKYAYDGKWIGVKTFLRNEELVVSVMDQGRGIPKAARQRVFRSFERLDNKVDEGSSGAGLGLSIAYELATKLGGELKLLDTETGCHFELSISATVICALEKNEGQEAI